MSRVLVEISMGIVVSDGFLLNESSIGFGVSAGLFTWTSLGLGPGVACRELRSVRAGDFCRRRLADCKFVGVVGGLFLVGRFGAVGVAGLATGSFPCLVLRAGFRLGCFGATAARLVCC